MNKKYAVLDLSGCQYINELHDRIKKELNFPEHYGRNLDAFWDCINSECDVDFITVIGSSDVSDELKPTVTKIIKMLEENKQDWADSDCPFDYEIVS